MKLTCNKSGFHLTGAVLLACCATLSARADYFGTVTNQGPVGYWRLNETTQPPTTTVAALNQGTLGTSANGVYNNYPMRGGVGPFAGSVSVKVDGINQSVQAPYAAELNPSSFTIEAWMNPAKTVPSGNLTCALASMHSGSPRSGWLVYQSGGAPDTAAQGWQLRLYNQNGSAISVPLLVTNNHAPGTWVHLVFTYDSASSTAKGYLNGVLMNTATGGFVPNVDAVFSVGVRSDNGFYWEGQSAEVAYYGTALSDSVIASHYTTGTSNPSGYAAQITSSSPLVYYRFAETPDPVAANSGTKGAAGNGIYIATAQPGQPGPSNPPYPGFEADNKAVTFNRVSGAVSLPPMNLNTNTVTITAWVKPTGVQSNYAGIVFTRGGTTVSGLDIDGYGGLGVGYHWNNDALTYNWIPANDAQLPTLQDGVWGFVALVVQPTHAAIYIANSTDPNGFSAATNFVTHPVQNFEVNTLLGQDTSSNDRRFNGSIDEVAIFNRSLKAGEVYSQFAASVGNVAARIFGDPQSPPNALYAGDTLVLEVDAGGSAPMTYQWRKDGVNVAGQTTAVFTKANVQTTDSGNYDVVVQAATGTSLTSAQANVSVLPVEIPTLVQGPTSRTLYPGGTLNLTVQANGGALTYQWTKDGTAIAGATNSAYIVTSVVGTNAGSYAVTVNNRLGNISAGPATITIPAITAGSLEAAIVADKPEAWYRLDETSGSLTMWDAMGRHDGTWVGSPTLGAAGVAAGNSAVSFNRTVGNYGSVPFSALLNGREFTMECWVKTTDLVSEICPASSRVNTKGEWLYTRGGKWVGGVADGTANFYVPSDSVASTILANEWTHLAISYGTSSNGSLRVYFNGQWDGAGYVDFARNATGPLIIGARGLTFDSSTGASTVDMPFNGTVDEVVFFKTALAPAQIQNHFQSGLYGGNSKPVAKIQPVSQLATLGEAVSFSAYFEGTLPISYQWMLNGSPVAGATTTSLNIAAAAYNNVGTYSLVASNIAGVTPSANATLTVSPKIPLVLHLRFDGDYLDSSGRGNNGTAKGAPTIVAGKVGSGALHYSTDTAAQTYNYVSLGTPTDLAFGESSFTVAYWVRLPASYLGGDLPFFCSALNSYGGAGFTFAPSYQLGGWSWYINSGTGAGLYGPDGSINNGEWHHLLHSFDRIAGSCITYLDGASVNTNSIADVGNINTAGPVNVGQDPSGTYGETGSADLDDLAAWRGALTQSDAVAIYQAGLSGTSFDSYWPGPVTIFTASVNGKLIISWQAGTLQEASSLSGPWTPVTGATAPNFIVTPATTGGKFYRVQL